MSRAWAVAYKSDHQFCICIEVGSFSDMRVFSFSFTHFLQRANTFIHFQNIFHFLGGCNFFDKSTSLALIFHEEILTFCSVNKNLNKFIEFEF
jgi:hypothetical protein